MTVPPGGPATINGILYQMLWCLLEAAKIHIDEHGFEKDDEDNAIKSAQLLIEPTSGGGDAQRGQRVVQLKAKSDEGSWSLRSIIESVFPDLYRAVDTQKDDQVLEFVTEGTIGKWTDLNEFFKSLRTRAIPEESPLDALDDEEMIFTPRKRRKDAKSAPFWDQPSYTEKALFLRIAQELQKVKPASEETEETTYRKLWHLLGRFKFTGEQTQERLQREVESLLLAVIPSRDTLRAKSDELIGALASTATRGNVTIDATAFLTERGLAGIPLNQKGWPALRRRAYAHWRGRRNELGYEPGQDVRASLARTAAERWCPGSPILVFSGESGQGKSWSLYALGEILSADPALVLLVEATGQKDSTITQAKDDFVEIIWNHDDGPPLRRIGVRFRETFPGLGNRWLTLLIDGLQDVEEADQLARVPWEDWGIRLAVSASPQAAEALKAAARGRTVEFVVSNFSVEELGEFLEVRCGERWIEIPGDVRTVLRRPLLASLYSAVAEGPRWMPKTEYELLEGFWNRLYVGRQSAYPTDPSRLLRLALSFLDRTPDYPWRAGHLENASIGNEEVSRLTRLGWLRRIGREQFEISHDRLLNWAVAKGLVEAVRDGSLSSTQLAENIADFASGNPVRAGRMLGYVPMDVMWLLLDPTQPLFDVADEVTSRLATTGYLFRAELHEHLLPTLGERALPLLFRRLHVATEAPGNPMELDSLTGAIANIGGPAVDAEAVHLLEQDSPLRQRAAMRLLAYHPVATALDRLWALHVSIVADSSPFHLSERDHETFVYRDSFNALKSCAQLGLSWVERRIQVADPNVEPVHDLCYLVANLRDEGLWQRCKPILMAKIPTSRMRSIAINIRVHRDLAEIRWLSDQIERTEDIVGLVALRALSVLDADRAIDSIARLPRAEFYVGRSNWLPELLARKPSALGPRFNELVAEDPSDWRVLSAFQGLEDRLPVEILESLLDSLEQLLDAHLAAGIEEDIPLLIVRLEMLKKVWRPHLLDRFRERRDTPFEEKLVEWLLQLGPRPNATGDRHGRSDAIEVLRKIGGNGFGRVVRHYLDSSSQDAKRDGVELSFKAPDRETIERVGCIAASETLWDIGVKQVPLLQSESMKSLATTQSWGELVQAVSRWGAWCPPEVLSSRVGKSPLDDHNVQRAIDAVLAESDPGIGPILALGMAGRKDLLERILKVCQELPRDSQTAIGGVITLGLLGEDSRQVLSFLTSCLSIDNQRSLAETALLRIGGDAAHRTLFEHLRVRFDLKTAIFLLASTQSPHEVAGLITQQAKSARSHQRAELLAALFDGVKDEKRLDLVLSDPDLRALISDEALGGEAAYVAFDGARHTLIRALSRWSSQNAYVAARQSLRDVNSTDRERFAFLLSEINPQRAAGDLFDLLSSEQRTAVRWAIGQVLAGIASEEQLENWLGSKLATERCAACQVLGYLGDVDWQLNRLTELSNDPDDKVVDAALEAIHRRQTAKEVEVLIASYASEPDQARKWVLLDALIALGDPGLKGCPFPGWVLRAQQVIPHRARKYFSCQLAKQQESRAQAAQARDRQN